MAKQRIGVFCGSFDPFHHGHMAAVRHALSAERLDQMLVVLSTFPGEPPCNASSEDRWRMLVSACSGDKRLVPYRPEPADIRPGNLLPALREDPRFEILSEPYEWKFDGEGNLF